MGKTVDFAGFRALRLCAAFPEAGFTANLSAWALSSLDSQGLML